VLVAQVVPTPPGVTVASQHLVLLLPLMVAVAVARIPAGLLGRGEMEALVVALALSITLEVQQQVMDKEMTEATESPVIPSAVVAAVQIKQV